jgi:hypothetical protein
MLLAAESLSSRKALGQGAIGGEAVDKNSPTAAGDSNASDLDEARAAFRRGTALAAQGAWSEALAQFERSARLRPHTFTTYNIAYCERALGRYTRARKQFAKALADDRAQNATALPSGVAPQAAAYLAEIESRLVRLHVGLEPGDVSVSVDGRPLEPTDAGEGIVLVAGTREPGPGEPAPASAFELWVDPGTHVFLVSKRGLPDSTVIRSFEPGARDDLKLTTRIATPQPPAEPSRADRPAMVSDANRGRLLPGYLALGVGAAGIAVGTLAGLVALQNKTNLDRACGNSRAACPSSARSDLDSLKSWADISTVSFAIGVTATVGSVVLLATSISSTPDHAGHVLSLRGVF